MEKYKQPMTAPRSLTMVETKKSNRSAGPVQEPKTATSFHEKGWNDKLYAYGGTDKNIIPVPEAGDDYFDKYGNYIGSTQSETNNVRIITDDILAEKLRKNSPQSIDPSVVFPNSILVADLDYNDCDTNGPHAMMLSEIATYYASKAGIDQCVRAERHVKADEGGMAYFHSPDKNNPDGYYAVAVAKDGKIKSALNDKYAFINTFVHEKNHHDDPNTRSNPLNHVDAILTQSKHPTWALTPKSFRTQMAAYAAMLLSSALNKGVPLETVKKKIDEVNASPVSQGAELYYDETDKMVLYMMTLDNVEINGNSKD